MYAELAKTDDGRARLKRADVRIGRALEGHAELQADAEAQGREVKAIFLIPLKVPPPILNLFLLNPVSRSSVQVLMLNPYDER